MKVDSLEVGHEHQLLAAYVTKAVNKIAQARLVYLDGAASSGDFPLSNASTFLPGKKVEILAGAGSNPVSLFKGVVVRQSLKVREHSGPQLVVECRHQAVELTVGRKNACFFDQKDSDAITTLLQQASIGADVEATQVTHKSLVQYNSTDWDFLLTRAEASGKLVFTNDGKVTVKAPAAGGNPVCTLEFGATIIDMDLEVDARRQYKAVKCFTWDAANQEVVEKAAADPGLGVPGNLKSDDLAAVVGLDFYRLQNAAISQEEAQAWADSQWLKAKLSQVCGRIKCEGMATVNPGDKVKLAGGGDRFSGEVFVTGLRQDFDTVQGWKTHVQFGGVDQWLAEEPGVSGPKAAALLPGVNGLQIGVVMDNEDPEGEDRVQVYLPLGNPTQGIWARVAVLDAGQDRGFFFRPEVGDEVVLGFLNDDPRQPVILGMLHSSAKPAPLRGSNDNHEKVYQSREKMKLYFNDDQKVMRLETPGGNKVTLSEQDKAIKIEDQNGNKLEMTQDGIKLESVKAITLKAQTEVKLESSTAFSVKGGTELKLQGTSSAELSSTGTTKVKGALVQIN